MAVNLLINYQIKTNKKVIFLKISMWVLIERKISSTLKISLPKIENFIHKNKHEIYFRVILKYK